MKQYNVAILGATGAVCQEMMKILAERDFPVAQLHLLASPRSVGQKMQWKGQELTVELACDEAVAAGLSDAQRLAYARTILAQAPRRAAALSLAGPPVRERILFLTKKQRTSVLCAILALLLIVSAAGCSITELTRQKTGEITLPKETPVMEEPTDTPEPADTPIEQEEPIQEPQTQMLPIPASSMFGLTGREAVLFDAAVAQRYPRDDNEPARIRFI